MAEETFVDKSIDRIRNIHHGNFFDYLSSAYEVLRKIFSYLPLDDLENISKTFERWRPIVETTKKERTDIELFLCTDELRKLDVWSEACFCITICSGDNKKLVKKLRKHLTDDAKFIVIKARAGIIGVPNNIPQVIYQKLVDPSAKPPLASHLRIPSLPGVGIKTFVWNRKISFEDFQSNFKLPENQIIKCLLILITVQDRNEKSCEQKDDFVLYLQSTQEESFAVGGCLVDMFVEDIEDKPVAATAYIVFYGDKVEAASTVLTQHISTKEKINFEVEELKLTCPKTNQGVLFVFRCCSRSRISRQSKVKKNIIKWEDDALQKHFPSAQIVGCCGYGEFGKKFPEDVETTYKRGRQSDIWEYSFSTSLVYVGFKC